MRFAWWCEWKCEWSGGEKEEGEGVVVEPLEHLVLVEERSGKHIEI